MRCKIVSGVTILSGELRNSSSWSPPHWESSLQDEHPVPPCFCGAWCATGLLLATHFVLLSAEAGISAVCNV